mgnify:FL=1
MACLVLYNTETTPLIGAYITSSAERIATPSPMIPLANKGSLTWINSITSPDTGDVIISFGLKLFLIGSFLT